MENLACSYNKWQTFRNKFRWYSMFFKIPDRYNVSDAPSCPLLPPLTQYLWREETSKKTQYFGNVDQERLQHFRLRTGAAFSSAKFLQHNRQNGSPFRRSLGRYSFVGGRKMRDTDTKTTLNRHGTLSVPEGAKSRRKSAIVTEFTSRKVLLSGPHGISMRNDYITMAMYFGKMR